MLARKSLIPPPTNWVGEETEGERLLGVPSLSVSPMRDLQISHGLLKRLRFSSFARFGEHLQTVQYSPCVRQSQGGFFRVAARSMHKSNVVATQLISVQWDLNSLGQQSAAKSISTVAARALAGYNSGKIILYILYNILKTHTVQSFNLPGWFWGFIAKVAPLLRQLICRSNSSLQTPHT